MRELDALLRTTRVASGRWAAGTTWGPCDADSATGEIPRLACKPGLVSRRKRVSALSDVAHLAENENNPDALRLRAMLAMEGPTGESDADLPARLMGRALVLGRETPALLNDAAVIWLWKAERSQKMRDLLTALDFAERAYAADTTNVPAAFNRALILTRLHLAGGAERAWAGYHRLNDDRLWRAEGLTHQQSLDAGRAGVPQTVDWLAATADERATVARHHPEATRDTVWSLLTAWGRSVTAGTANDTALGRARAAARALAGASADSTLLRIVERAMTTPELATAHLQLNRGTQAVQQGRLIDALAVLDSARRTFDKWESAAGSWSAYQMVVALVGQGRHAEGDSVFQRVLREIPRSHRVLQARTELGLGVSRVRRGDYAAAVAWYRAAARTIAETMERETRGHTTYVLAEGLSRAGLSAEAERAALAGLGQLMTTPQVPARGNLLMMVGGIARHAGLLHATVALADEAVLAARRSANNAVLALALAERARARRAALGSGAGDADAEEARRIALALPAGRGLDRVRGGVLAVRGEVLLDAQLPDAEEELLQAVQLLGQGPEEPLLPHALQLLANAQLRRGDTVTARRTLQRAMQGLEAQSRTAEVVELRAAFSETVEGVFDLAIQLDLAGGSPWDALATLERARRLAWEREGAAPDAASLRAQLTSRGGRTTLAFALLPTRVIGWCIAKGRITQFGQSIGRDSVALLAARMSGSAGSSAVRGASAALFDVLLRPAEPCLQADDRIDVLADRELTLVPFAGLWDQARGEYAVQRYQITQLVGLGSPDRPVVRTRRALVASEGGDAGSELPPLPGASAEVDAVLAIHGGGVALRGGEASARRFAAAIQEAGFIHFAGHAVNDPEIPAQSWLALGRAEKTEDGRIFAREIGKLRLSHTRVVVLSACRTLGAGTTRSAGVNGLALSFVRAGAQGAISTLWDIGDERAGELVVEVHRGLAAGMGGAEALRRAQLKAVRGGGALSAPRVWAAFTYTGT
jgi:tetratricopeptide (TPR) repeat protein